MTLPDPDRICVAVCVDRWYAAPLAVTVRSLLEHLDPTASVRLFVLSADLQAVDLAYLRAAWAGHPVAAELVFPPTLDWVSRVRYSGHAGQPAAYFRLLLGDLLPADVTRVLYLDSDLLVERDLAALWATPLRGHTAAAVWHPTMHYVQSHYGRDACTAFGVPPRCPYFNSGVLLIDLARWRHREVGTRAMRLAERFRHAFHTHDQCPLNVALAGDWTPLHPRWNAQSPLWAIPAAAAPYPAGEFQDALTAPAVVHFTRREKPWQSACRHPYAPRWRDVARSVGVRPPLPAPDPQVTRWQATAYDLRQRFSDTLSLVRSGVPVRAAWPVFAGRAVRHPVAAAVVLAEWAGRVLLRACRGGRLTPTRPARDHTAESPEGE